MSKENYCPEMKERYLVIPDLFEMIFQSPHRPKKRNKGIKNQVFLETKKMVDIYKEIIHII